ncbi:MAG: alpha/beta fold hydrolase [Salinibacterium sp.]|nr:alpha/beta fold hydrolase [Salinibacterium sp.]
MDQPTDNTPASLRVEFAGAHGTNLAARLELPGGTPRAFAIFAHCFSCSKDVFAASRIAKALAASGIAVLRFDFTGLGQSDGDFSNTNFTSNIDDLVNAADFLRTEYRAPGILIGHSLGGAAVLAATHRIPEVRAVATIAAPSDPGHVVNLIEDDLATIREQGFAEVHLGGSTFNVKEQFLDDVAEQPQAERIRDLGVPLLVMHSPVDRTVPIDDARAIFDQAKHPKSFVALDGADHLLTRRGDSEFAAAIISAWAGRYALDATAHTAAPASGMGATDSAQTTMDVERYPGIVIVEETGNGDFQQRVTSGQHTLLADEPIPMGTDTGLAPYEFLLAGLGACTSMTLRMYAKRKGIPLERVRVELGHSRIHAEDCENCETQTGHVDHIERWITLTGNLTGEQKTRLMEIADRCPVHRTLHSEINITSELVGSAVSPESSA